jgi:hypothetical protein
MLTCLSYHSILINHLTGLPYIASKNVHTLHPLRRGSFAIIRNEKCTMYIGEVLDLYKKRKNRHGSVPSSSNSVELSYLSLRVYRALDSDIVSDHIFRITHSKCIIVSESNLMHLTTTTTRIS